MRMIHICIKRTEKKKKILRYYKATNNINAKDQNISIKSTREHAT